MSLSSSRGRDRRPARPLRLRQVLAAAHRRRPRLPRRGQGHLRGTAPVTGPVDGVAMVFQSFALFPWLTVLANVEIGLRAKGVSEDDARKRALKLRSISSGSTGSSRPFRRSSPAACASASASPARSSSIRRSCSWTSPSRRSTCSPPRRLRTDLLDLWVEGRMPIKSILMVTHNIEEAVLMCDRIVVLSSNPGRIAAEIAGDDAASAQPPRSPPSARWSTTSTR